jgi:MFS family permease
MGAPSSTRAWGVVALLWVAFLLNYIDRQAVFSIYPSLRSDLRFTNGELGLIGSIFLWVYSVSSVVTGRMSDRLPKAAVLCSCLLIWSMATMGTGFSNSPQVFLFWRAVMGVSESMYLPASMALIAILHTGETRSTALSLHQTAQMTGIVLGAWIGGSMADHFGWRSAFMLLATAGICYTPALWTGLRQLPESSPKLSGAGNWKIALRSRCYLALAGAFTAYCTMLWILYAWFPIHLYEQFHLSQAQSGLAATLYLQGSTAAGVVFWGIVTDRLTRRTMAARFLVLGIGIAASAPFAWMALSLGTLFAVKLASAAFGFFAGGLHANIAAAPFDVVPPGNFGVALGTLNLIGGAGGGAAILLTGMYRDAIGIGSLMGLCSAASVIGAICMVSIVIAYLPREYCAVQSF